MKTVAVTDPQELINIISQCDICFVAVSDLECTPYVVPMNFGYNDGYIYLHSAQQGQILDILATNNKVSIAFNTGHELIYQHPDVACSYRMKSHSVIITGHVEFEEDLEQKEHILNLLMKNYVKDRSFKYSTPALQNVKVWKVQIQHISGKQFAAPHS